MSGPKAELYFNSDLFMGKLLSEFAQAQTSIDIETYIWAADTVGHRFFETIIAAANRGVKVRILLDGIGSLEWIQKGLGKKHPHIETRVYHKFPGLQLFVHLKRFFLLLGRLNKRNHRKIYIIDKKVVYIGSFNICQQSLDSVEAAARFSDDFTIKFQEIFEYTWRVSANFLERTRQFIWYQLERKFVQNDYIFLTQTFGLRTLYRKMLYERLARAKNRVWLMSPYFNPPPLFLKYLTGAAQRGVDVKVILPELTDHIVLSWMARLHYSNLLKAGVKIYEYSPKFLHSKLSVFDNAVIVGSGNLNYRSFFRDLELNVLLENADNVKNVEQHFLECMEKSQKIENLRANYIWQTLGARLLMFFKDWF